MTIHRLTISRPLVPRKLRYRWYVIDHAWDVVIHTDCGVIRIHVAPGFQFDGRSGGPAIDWLVPNLGTTEEVWAWALHDLLGHGIYGGFEFCNDCLYWVLRNLAKYPHWKAELVRNAVSISDDWYGEPGPDDKSFPNLKLMTVRHDAK